MKHFSHFALQVKVKGEALNIHDPQLFPKCSVAHKVLALDKWSGKEKNNCYGVTGGKLAQSD